MDFKISIPNASIIRHLALVGLLIPTAACSLNTLPSTTKQERVIGERLQTISLPDRDSGSMDHIALFDKTTHMIHQFDLVDMHYDRGLQVESPDLEHAVLFDSNGNYVIDFAEKTISIFDSSGSKQRNPLHMPGQPISAAFRPRLGDLAIYDSTGAIGLLKLDTEGHVTASAVFGSAVAASSGSVMSGDLTLVAADLTENGQLVVALSDDSISVFDFDQSVRTPSSQIWTPLSHFATTFSNITWVAPVRGQTHLVLVKDDRGMNLVNLTTHAVISTYRLTNFEEITILAKSVDAHFITNDASGKAVRIGYVDLGSAADGSTATLKTKMLNLDPHGVVASRLNLQTNSWMLISQPVVDGEAERTTQDVLQYRFSSLLAEGHHLYPLKATVKLLESEAFALYPSALGHATTCQIQSNTEHAIDYFNVGR